MNPIVNGIPSFRGEYAFLSNFWPAQVEMYGKTYPTVEHAFAAAKTLDESERERIRVAPNPSAAKRLGRSVTLRPDWNAFRLLAMKKLLRQKFHAGSELALKLLETGDNRLEEGNSWHDQFWGITPSGKGHFRGQNWLGTLLMEVRAELRAQPGQTSPGLARVYGITYGNTAT